MALSSLIVLLVYLFTMAPTLSWKHYGADGGDFVTAAVQSSIPHPPGFPVYLLLGDLFVRLPFGDPAWRLNLMSAVSASGATGFVVLATWLLLRRSANDDQVTALCAITLTVGLSFGLAPLLWSQALITEVYTLATFFASLIVFLAICRRWTWVLGLAWGIGMGSHPTLLFLAPVVGWGIWGNVEGRWQRLLLVFLSALLGWGMTYGPLLLVRGKVPSPWADVSTLAGWWALVSGKLYRGYVFELPLVDWPRRLLAWAGLLARQFTPVGAVLTGMGLRSLWRKRSSLAAVLALSFAVCSLYAMGYNTADSLVYLAPVLPLAALWLGEGLMQVVGWLNRRAPGAMWAFLLLPLAQAVLFWGQMNLSDDRAATEWAEQVLRDAPPEAVLLTAQDAHTFTLWYAHDALGQRPDVAVVDLDLWGHEPYRKMMKGEFGPFEDGLSPEQVAQLRGRRVVYVSDQLAEESR